MLVEAQAVLAEFGLDIADLTLMGFAIDAIVVGLVLKLRGKKEPA